MKEQKSATASRTAAETENPVIVLLMWGVKKEKHSSAAAHSEEKNRA